MIYFKSCTIIYNIIAAHTAMFSRYVYFIINLVTVRGVGLQLNNAVLVGEQRGIIPRHCDCTVTISKYAAVIISQSYAD